MCISELKRWKIQERQYKPEKIAVCLSIKVLEILSLSAGFKHH